MKFKAEDGTEWEELPDDPGRPFFDDHTVIRRIPEKSELQKWIESLDGDFSVLTLQGAKEFFIDQGFKKAIEVAEGIRDRSRTFSYAEYASPGHLLETSGMGILITALKTFAGIK